MGVQILDRLEGSLATKPRMGDAIGAFLGNMIQGGMQGNRNKTFRDAARKQLGIEIPEGSDAEKIYTTLMQKKFESDVEVSSKNKGLKELLGMLDEGNATPPSAGGYMEGISQPSATTPSTAGANLKRLIVAGQLKKDFGIELPPTPEEKKQAIQSKVDEARAMEEGKPLSADAAGKLAMVTQAESDLNEAEQLLFPNGKFSPGMAFQTNFPGGGVPATEGRQAFSKVLNAVNAKLRVETGAQANPSEVKNILQRFLPTVRDSDITAKDKFRRLKEFMSSTKSIIDPRGRFNKETQPSGKTSSGVGYTIE